MQNDLAFHQALAEACKNPVFALLIGAFQGITRQTWPIGWRSRTDKTARDTMLNTHMAIARAIEAGDPVEASRLMGLHFDESLRVLLDAGIA
jgi:GntR family transcriptional regulator, transcriptional repressor for pyruvate dehydrogenase complex